MGLKVVFMGSPEIALPSVKAIAASSHRLVGVVSQPDRPAGRGREITPPPIAAWARKSGLPILQPEKLRNNPEVPAALERFAPDVIAVVAYGRILPPEILNLPRLGCVNVHFSLLPKYRGAAPLQWALINGEEETGVTTFLLNEELDTGPVLLQKKVMIHDEDDATILGHRLSNIGADLLVKTLDTLESGSAEPAPQNERLATLAPLLKKEDGRIDWTRKAKAVWGQVRGMTPWPGAFTTWKKASLKIHRAECDAVARSGAPGQVVEINNEGLHVSCGQGVLLVKELQLEGGKRLAAKDFLKGHPVAVGERFGETS